MLAYIVNINIRFFNKKSYLFKLVYGYLIKDKKIVVISNKLIRKNILIYD